MSGEVLALVVMSLINSISKSSEMGTGLKGIKVPVKGVKRRDGTGPGLAEASWLILGRYCCVEKMVHAFSLLFKDADQRQQRTQD